MVSVSVSEVDYTGLPFISTGVKLNDVYYCDTFLSQHLLAAMCHISGKFIFSKHTVHIFHKILQQSFEVSK